MFAGSQGGASTRATCVGSSCFDTIFDSTSQRTSVDMSTQQSLSMWMNYNSATKTARTTAVTVDSPATPNVPGKDHTFLVSCIDCWAYVSASITFAASFQLLIDNTFPPANFQQANVGNAKLNIL